MSSFDMFGSPRLFLPYKRRRIHHQVHRARGLEKWNHFAQTLRSGQNHHNAIKTESDPAVGWSAIFQRFEKESETRLSLLFRHPKRAENFALNVLSMNSN